MLKKKRKSFIILLSAIIAVMLILSCAFMLTPKTSASADTEETHDHSAMTIINSYADIENGELTEGTYYLGNNINGNIIVTGEVTLCLNGHTITGDGNDSVITVGLEATFTLCDCQETGTVTGGHSDGGVYVKENATFKMTGGTISGNTAGGYGGGVYVKENATFTMTGGTIARNTAGGGYGGGVYVNGTFEISGGTISGNIGVGGVRVNGTFEISGAPVITGNMYYDYLDDREINVALDEGYKITITGELTVGAQIGVSTVDEVITSGYGENNKDENGNIIAPSAYFISDVEGCVPTLDGGEVKLVESVATVTVGSVETAHGDIASAFATANSSYGAATVTLLANVETTDTLTVGIAKYITLDLNGHMLKYTGSDNKSVITVNGNFTLKDSNPQAAHKYNINDDGLWVFTDSGTETLHGGVITGGKASGVFADSPSMNGSVFTLENGNICGNTATNGGGVNVTTNCRFEMKAGKISGNTATNGGGVDARAYGCYFIMTGGTISGNTATGDGGGMLWSGLLNGFHISGAPVITGNKANGIDNNVYLLGSYTIRVVGEFTNGAQIGVYSTGEIATGFTAANGMSGKLPSEYFIPDNKTNNCVYVSDEGNGTVSVGTHDYDNAPWLISDTAHWKDCQNGCGNFIDSYSHNYNQEVVSDTYFKSAATCTEKAVYYKSCKCGAHGEETFENGELASHTYAEAVRENEKAPTCTQEGRYDEVVYCSVCDEELSRTPKTIDKIAHDEEIIPAVDATCTAKGKTEGKKCNVCGTVTVAQVETDMIPHTEEVIPAKAATCTAKGKTEGKKCSVCGETLVAQTETDKIAHTEEVIPAVSATCTAKGKTKGKKCSVCGETLVAQTETDKIAHTEEVIPAVAPTCTEAGKTAGKHCSVCNTVLQAQTTVAALGHNYGEWTVVKQATETEEGEERRVCANDNAHYESRTLPKITAPDNNGSEVVENKPQNGLSAGAIAGIVIGVIIFLLLAAYVACYFALYRRNLIEGKFFDVIYAPMNAIFGKKEQETE